MVKIPFSLILPDRNLQEKYNEQLRLNQRPFIIVAICFTSIIFIIGMTRMAITDQKFDGKFIVLLILLMSISVLALPKHQTKIILFFRLLACFILVYAYIQIFEGKDVCHGSIEFYKLFFVKRQFTVSIYIIMSIFLTPFQDHYFLTWMMTTAFFAIEYFMVE